ncbi:DEKNAAC102891 [Brettanomyces naardenensis]|uniref:DEKNAAC102891 n=1 Tax=Brettanomyces naardenensis TaxID=13370 RepID=A0A448YLZ8_BRENA|nr:DEKNAAC102891 [Brettanomyces naardenensis]
MTAVDSISGLSSKLSTSHDSLTGTASVIADYSSDDITTGDEMEVGSVHEVVKLPIQEFKVEEKRNRDNDRHGSLSIDRVLSLEAENSELKGRIEQLLKELGRKDAEIFRLKSKCGEVVVQREGGASEDQADTLSNSSSPPSPVLPERSEGRTVIRNSVASAVSAMSATSSHYSVSSVGRSPANLVTYPLTPPNREAAGISRVQEVQEPQDRVSHVLLGEMLLGSSPRYSSPAKSPPVSRTSSISRKSSVSKNAMASSGTLTFHSTNSPLRRSLDLNAETADSFEFEESRDREKQDRPERNHRQKQQQQQQQQHEEEQPQPPPQQDKLERHGTRRSERRSSGSSSHPPPQPTHIPPHLAVPNLAPPLPPLSPLTPQSSSSQPPISPLPTPDNLVSSPFVSPSGKSPALRRDSAVRSALVRNSPSPTRRPSHPPVPQLATRAVQQEPDLMPPPRHIPKHKKQERPAVPRANGLSINTTNALEAPAISIPRDDSSTSVLSSGSGQYDYLRNSIDTTVISVYSVVDPNALLSSHKLDDFMIRFLVNSSELAKELKPLYMVKRKYSEFLAMDSEIRQTVRLPQLPDRSHFLRIDPINWDTQKSIIRMYVTQLCSIMRQNKDSPIWRTFTSFFTPDDDGDVSKHCGFFVPAGSRGLKKSPRLVRLEYDTIEHLIRIEDDHSKGPEVLSVGDIVVTRDGQVLTLSKRRKRTFKSNRHWTLYCESVQDADDWYNELTTAAAENAEGSESASEAPSPRRGNLPLLKNAGGSSSTIIPSPVMENPKWFGFRLGKDALHLTHSVSSNSSNVAATVDYAASSSSFPSPQSKNSNAASMSSVNSNRGRFSRSAENLMGNENVLDFKAVPYEGTLSTSPSSSVRASPSKLADAGAGIFKQIDETPKYFGSTLQSAYDSCPKYRISGRAVPSIVYRCITYLDEKNAVLNEGIFRLNGMMTEVNMIQRLFNESSDCDFAELSSRPDVHSIATLLKRFLRTLKVTIIPEQEAKTLLQLTMSTEYSETVPKFRQVLFSLPQLNYDVLYVLFRYFREVLKFKDVNKMSVGAISVLMAPNLTPFDGAKEICAELLINYAYYFEDGRILSEEERERV